MIGRIGITLLLIGWISLVTAKAIGALDVPWWILSAPLWIPLPLIVLFLGLAVLREA
jgi:hypothetical protein